MRTCPHYLFFFFNDTATTEIYTLSLHDALPILNSQSFTSSCSLRIVVSLSINGKVICSLFSANCETRAHSKSSPARPRMACSDRKSTRLNSSHSQISYAVFCLKNNSSHNYEVDV